MFGWLSRVFHWGTANIGGAIIGFINDVINGVWGVLHTLFGNVGASWGGMFAAGYHLWQMCAKFGESILADFYHIYKIVLPAIVNWARTQLHNLNAFITSVEKWAARELTMLRLFVDRMIADVRSWAIRDIFRPLFGSLEKAWHWIFNEGSTMLYYFMHPDKFADFLWDSLIAETEKQAWKAGQLLGGFFLSLVLHNAKRFMLLIEDIVMAVL